MLWPGRQAREGRTPPSSSGSDAGIEAWHCRHSRRTHSELGDDLTGVLSRGDRILGASMPGAEQAALCGSTAATGWRPAAAAARHRRRLPTPASRRLGAPGGAPSELLIATRPPVDGCGKPSVARRPLAEPCCRVPLPPASAGSSAWIGVMSAAGADGWQPCFTACWAAAPLAPSSLPRVCPLRIMFLHGTCWNVTPAFHAHSCWCPADMLGCRHAVTVLPVWCRHIQPLCCICRLSPSAPLPVLTTDGD